MPAAAPRYTVHDNPAKRRFEVDLGDAIAIADYLVRPGRILFTHTEVPPNHEGRGVGTALIRAGLAHARKHRLKVVPICPFFAHYIREHPEEQDLLDPAWRTKLGLNVA